MSRDDDLRRQIAHLSPAKQKLLLAKLEAKRRKERQARGDDAIPVSPLRAEGRPLPVAHAQERLWFLHQLDPDSPAYHLPSRLRLEGTFAAPAMAQALASVVARHESLRSRFPADDGRPRLEIVPAAEVPAARTLPLVDLTDLPVNDRLAEASRLGDAVARRPFDLARGPLLRRALLRLGPDDHRLALNLHHIVSDGWSRGLLVREATALYGAFTGGRPANLPKPPIGYGDYAHWQRRRLNGERLEALSEHWRSTLDGAPAALDLPFDRPPRPQPSHRGGRHRFEIPAETLTGLKTLAASVPGATLFTVAAAAFGAFLARHAGSGGEVVVGTPVAGRDRREVEGLIGLFVNTLALRLPGASGTPKQLIERTRKTLTDAFEHADMPFERLVADLDPDRSGGRPPVFQTMLVLQNLPPAEGELPGLSVHLEEPPPSTAKAELILHLSERDSEGGDRSLAGSFEYARDLFDGATVERLAERFRVFTAAFAANPATEVTALPLMTEAEATTVTRWGSVRQPSAPEQTPLTRFRAVAQALPDRVAVVDGDRHFSYGHLITAADAEGRRLASAGVVPGDVVAVAAERQAELIPAVLGAWAAGAAYLPLDPAHPEERRRFTVEDAGARVVAGDPHPASPDDGQTSLPPANGPEHTAYVIYTSGSTGRPKGVPISLGQITRLMTTTEGMFDFHQRDDAPDSWCLFHSPAFDFSVWEIWGALLYGGRLVVVPYLTSRSPEAFARLLLEERLTVLNQTPSAFYALAPHLLGARELPLRWVVFGGEALDPAALAEWFEAHPPRQAATQPRHGLKPVATHSRALGRAPGGGVGGGEGVGAEAEGGGPVLVNMYGITEITVHATYRVVGPEDARPRAGVNGPEPVRSAIGVPLPDLGIRVLTAAGRPVPPGVTGEICVEGAGVARGYLNRPALTAQRFVPVDGDEPGARRYRSGDLGRWRSGEDGQGDLEYLGRMDHQVQLRGFRVELGEIEAALLAEDGVREAVVLPRGSGDRLRLVAFLVGDLGGDPESSSFRADLRAGLARRVPEYMIPATFAVLPALPLTANGKVDRRALDALPLDEAAALGAASADYEAPREGVEEILARLFAEVLQIDRRVGAGDSFFDLGGHSLLATQLVSRVRETFADRLRDELPLADLFEEPTVRGLAERVTARFGDRVEDAAAPPALTRRPADAGPAPLSFSQERLWFLDRFEPGTPAYDISLNLDLTGPLSVRRLRHALAATVDRHEVLRSRFPETADGPVQQVLDPADLFATTPGSTPGEPPGPPLPLVDLSRLADADRDRARDAHTRALTRHSFDLARGPLLTGALLRLGPGRHRLLLTVHHVVADGWSLGVLGGEIPALDAAFAAGRPSPLPPLDLQYADYAAWQRSWLTGAELDRQVDYWRQAVADVPSLELPTDRPRPAVQSLAGATVPWSLSAGTTAALTALARSRGGTLFMALLAGYRTLLARLAGQRRMAVGTFVANRIRRDIEPLVGFFVNNLALPGAVAPDRPFAEQVATERAVALDAYRHQHLPFEKLLEELDVPRDMSRTPIFQVMLVLQNTPDARLSLADVDSTPVSKGGARSNFDLTLWTLEEPDGSLGGGFEYATALFDRPTIARFGRQLAGLLQAAVAAPDTPLADLPLLTQEERRQVTYTWATTPLPTASDSLSVSPATHRSVPGERGASVGDRSVFERSEFATGRGGRPHARRPSPLPEHFRTLAASPHHADTVAVTAPGTPERDSSHLTYGGLHTRAETLAARLTAAGVAPGDRVALYAERTPEVLAAVVACHHLGAAYVSLDAAYGAARLPAILDEANPKALLTADRYLDPADPLRSALPVIDLYAPNDPTATPPPPAPIDASDPAYVLYTSGSTGRPKGVVVDHGGLAALRDAWEAAYDLRPGQAHLQTASLSFDVFAGDWVRAFGTGGRLVLAPTEARLDPHALWDLIVREAIALTEVVPAVARPIADRLEAEGGDLAPLEVLVVGSDAWYVEEMRRLERLLPPGGRLVDSYGVTEATIDSTYYEAGTAGSEALPGEALAPVGRPYPGLAAFTVDPRLRPLPVGVPGELLLGGPGVSQGYLGRPALTAQTFVPDPFSEIPGARVYRSGDRARWLEGGQLSLLGRVDHQLKIRGFRIEPGEIEAVLGDHPAVTGAVVTGKTAAADRDDRDEQRLVAYVTLREGIPPATLREHVAERLPDYMVPRVFVVLDSFPLNPSGKVDRKALPEPDWGVAAGVERVPPRPGTETALAAIFDQVTGGPRTTDPGASDLEPDPEPRAGALDDFFALGGHSLSATRLVSRVRDELGVELPLRSVFETPTVRGLAKRVDDLLRGQDGDAAGHTPPPIEPRPAALRHRPLPVSFGQERLWLLDRAGAGAAYNLPSAVAVDGHLDLPRLADALAAVVGRHESLRTTFREEDGEPRQVVAPTHRSPLPVTDLSGLSEGDRLRVSQTLAAAEARRPFDLARGPLLRVRVLRLGGKDPDRHVVLVTLHHIVSDAWSMTLFWQELVGRYRGGAALAPLAVQYPDYALWHRSWLEEGEAERQLTYWTQRLADLPPALDLPTDRPRPAELSGRGRRLPVRLAPAAVAALEKLAEHHGATLFMAVLALHATLLHRLGGQSRLAVGTPTANRPRRELEELIGFFVNTLVLDVTVAPATGFGALLEDLRETTLDAFAHQDLPFEKLVETLAPRRDRSRTPLFQTMLVFQNVPLVPAAEGDSDGPTLEPLPATTGTAKFELGLELVETDGALVGSFEYPTDLFDDTTIERWRGHLETLATAVTLRPEAPLADLDLLTDAQRSQLLAVADAVHPAPAAPALLPDRFAAQVVEGPDRIAVSHEPLGGPGVHLSYGELDRRASDLARRLGGRLASDDREPLVAVHLPPSPETAVALLGIARAGAARAPLDPAHPEERRRAALAEAAPAAVVGWGRLTENEIPPVTGTDPGPYLETDPPLGADSPPDPLDPLDPMALDYVIFTSGSTGRPKAVAVSHGAVAHLLAWHQRELPTGPGDRIAVLGGPAFDVGVLELGTALGTGATAVVADPDTRRSGDALPGWLHARQVTRAFPVTALTEAVMTSDEPPAALAVLFSGGDRLVRRPRPDAPFRVVNGYGPTEATVLATTHEVAATAGAADTADPPAIGRAHDGTTAHVVGRTLRLQPPGVAGELVLGGLGLARGYRGQPARTAEVFVPDPFSPTPGARLYRTGDRVRRGAADGFELEFEGRVDRQVQVRGLRVEPGEIENALAGHPSVTAAVVLASGPDGEATASATRLSAFWVAATGAAAAPTESELREHLRARLPEAMVPADVIAIDALPLTANAKVDRDALRERFRDRLRALPLGAGPTATAVTWQSPTEEIVAGLWQATLEVPAVGPDDDFFALGGHSLLASRLTARLRETFGVEVPLAAVFEAPTVAGLAQRVDALGPEDPDDALGALERHLAEADGILLEAPLAPAQERFWILSRMDDSGSVYNVPLAVTLEGALRRSALDAALADLVRRQEALRTVFALTDDGPVQRVLDPVRALAALPPTPVVDLTGLPEDAREDEAARVAARAARRPFDLERLPVLHPVLVRVASGDGLGPGGEIVHHLLVTLPHTVADEGALPPLAAGLGDGYRAARSGRPADRPAPGLQVADWAARQRRRLDGPEGERLRAFWTTRLDGRTEPLELPADHPRPPRKTYRGTAVAETLAPELAAAVRERAAAWGATPYLVFLAAFQATLARLSGRARFIVGTPVSQRDHTELAAVMGVFQNTLALPADLSDDPSFERLVARVRNVFLEAHQHRDLPFEALVDALQLPRDLSRPPLVQVLFALLRGADGDGETPALDLPGLTVRPRGAGGDTVKTDLGMGVRDLASPNRPDGGFTVALTGATELFDETTVRRMLRLYLTTLERCLADPTAPVPAATAPPPAEAHLLLSEWTEQTPVTAPETLHGRVLAAGERFPDRIALRGGEEQWTFGHLRRRAEAVARGLRRRPVGVGPGSVVGIAMGRSPDQIAAVLGVLAAGAAYLPLDPDYPADRLAFMVADAGVSLILVDHRASELSWPAAVEVVTVGEVITAVDDAPLPAPAPVDPALPAYVIYTSGSTGRPKGVVVPHRAAAHRIHRQVAADFDGRPPCRFLHKTSLSFDVSVAEIFLPLSAGGLLVLGEAGKEKDPTYLGAFIPQAGVTHASAPPTLLRLLLDDPAFTAYRGLVSMATGGETVPTELPPVFFERLPGSGLDNRYGPTETTISVTCHPCLPPPFEERGRSLPIGRPIVDTEIYITDRRLRCQPLGVDGEIVIGGPVVATGYLGRPARTAEVFVPHPFSAVPGARLYRTGDLGRLRTDGEVEFGGRVDRQVKIRGFRVELGEIEAALSRQHGVRAAAVVDRPDADGVGRYLAAYVVPEESGDAAELPETLRRKLRETLPDHMVPTGWSVLDRLPVGPTGKVDRSRLPEPGSRADGNAERDLEPPANAVEEVLAGMFAEILELEEVGRREVFFELGGHSLSAARLLSWVREAFEMDISLARVFEEPTVAGLAQDLLADDAERSRVERTAELLIEMAEMDPDGLDGLDERDGLDEIDELDGLELEQEIEGA